MENYADYNFYVSKYQQGSLSQDLFSKRIIEASREIDRNVNRKLTPEVLNNLTDEELWQLKYTACKLCDYIESSKGLSSISGGSISIDGVSISGISQEEETTQKRNIITDNLPHELTRYL